MSVVGRAEFKSSILSSLADNTNELIKALTLRVVQQDIADSVAWLTNNDTISGQWTFSANATFSGGMTIGGIVIDASNLVTRRVSSPSDGHVGIWDNSNTRLNFATFSSLLTADDITGMSNISFAAAKTVHLPTNPTSTTTGALKFVGGNLMAYNSDNWYIVGSVNDSSSVLVSGTPTSGQLALWTGANTVEGSDFITVDATASTGPWNSLVLKAISDQATIDNTFANQISMYIGDSGGEEEVSRIKSRRFGADNTAILSFQVATAGTLSDVLQLYSEGAVLSTDDANLAIAGGSNNTSNLSFSAGGGLPGIDSGIQGWLMSADLTTDELSLIYSTGIADRAVFTIDENGNIDFESNDISGINDLTTDGDLIIAGDISKTGQLIVDATTGIDLDYNGNTQLSVEDGLVEVQGDLNLTGGNKKVSIKRTNFDMYLDLSHPSSYGEIRTRNEFNSTKHGFKFTSESTGGSTTFMDIANTSGAVNLSSLGTGTVYSNSGTLTNTNPSDERLKTIYGNYERGLSDLLKFNAISYNYEWDEKGNPVRSGYKANEVQNFAPELVGTFMHKQADGKEVERLGFVDVVPNPMLVNAIKELTKRIEQLESK